MKRPKSNSRKSRAQAMVEFALALPILLTLLYGVLETGRLLFIYASTVTAARQAVRYGSATGVNASNVPFYQDCAGIRAAAKGVGFIQRYNDSDITITYDRGLDFSGAVIQIQNPDPACASPFPVTIQNGDRIRVSVTTNWAPVIPFIPLNPLTITAKSERTILISIAIGVTAPPVGWVGYGTGTLTFDASPLQTSFTQAGEVITYNYTLSNLGTLDVVGPFAIVDSLAATSCPAGMPTTLTPGQVFICTGTYTIKQTDLDAGAISNTAWATSNGSPSPSVSMTLNAIQSPSLSLALTANKTYAKAGDVVTYTYAMTNTGNVSLSNPFGFTQSGVTCSDTTPIAPGTTRSCTSNYTVTSTDVTNLSVTRTSTATAMFGTTTITSNSSSVKVSTGPVVTTISAAPTVITGAGQAINFTYYLLNNTTATLNTASVTVNAPASGVTVTCPSAATTFASGATITCTGTYTVTPADMDTSSALVHTVKGSAKTTSGTVVNSDLATISIALVQVPSLSLSVSASPTTAFTAPTLITYTYTATNTGSVTLSSLVVTNDKASATTCTATTLAAGASTTCTSTYTTSSTDIDNGSVTLNATATAQFGATTVTSPNASATVITYNAPRVTLSITPNPSVTGGTNAFVNYTYTLRNTGNTILTSPYTITDDKIANASCVSAASSIPIGGATVCKGSYITTSTDVTNGSLMDTATVTATYATGTVSSTASATLIVSPSAACNIQHSVLKLPPFSAFGMTIFNNNSYSITISQITVNWNDTPSSQSITAVNLGGVDVWTGSSGTSPSAFNSFTGNVTIDPLNSMPLYITFGTPYTPFNSAQSSSTQETISISFTNPLCPSLDSFNNGQLQ